MRLDRGPIVLANFDVDADHAPPIECFAQTGIEHERAAVGHAGLDDHVGRHREDHFLNPQHVLGQLDDRAAQPTEAVHVFRVPAAAQPGPRHGGECLGTGQRKFAVDTRLAGADQVVFEVDGQHALSSPQSR